jgi:hypothetical protein
MIFDKLQVPTLPPGLDPRGPHEKRLNLDRLKKRVDDAKRAKRAKAQDRRV